MPLNRRKSFTLTASGQWFKYTVNVATANASEPFFTVTPSNLPSGVTLGGSDAGLASPAGAMTVDYVRWYTPQ